MNLLIDSLNCNPLTGSNAESGFGFLGEALKRHRVTLLTHADLFFPAGRPFAEAHAERLTVRAIRPGPFRRLGRQADYLARCYFHGRTLIRGGRIDLVHTVEPNQWLFPRPLCFLGAPFVLGPLHGGPAYPSAAFMADLARRYPGGRPRPRPRSLLQRLAHAVNESLAYGRTASILAGQAFRRARRIVIGTDNCLRAIPGRYHAKCRRLRSIGLDADRFRPGARPSNPAPVVLFVGRITEVKGLDFLIRAVARALQKRDLRLVVAGTGRGDLSDEAHESHCRELARSLSLEGRVDFLGAVPRERLPDLYRSADLFCLPSLWETYGLVYLEAMACGLPVVGIDAGGPSEILKDAFAVKIRPDGVEGLVRDLADVLVALASDAPRRAAMGERGRLEIETEYRWDVLGPGMERIYEESL